MNYTVAGSTALPTTGLVMANQLLLAVTLLMLGAAILSFTPIKRAVTRGRKS